MTGTCSCLLNLQDTLIFILNFNIQLVVLPVNQQIKLTKSCSTFFFSCRYFKQGHKGNIILHFQNKRFYSIFPLSLLLNSLMPLPIRRRGPSVYTNFPNLLTTYVNDLNFGMQLPHDKLQRMCDFYGCSATTSCLLDAELLHLMDTFYLFIL